MIFNSLSFQLFLPIVVIFYYLLPHRWRWILLLVASYYFYMCWKPEYALLIAFSTIVDYSCAIKMEGCASKQGRRGWLATSLTSNLGLLFTFKYLDFFSDSVNILFNREVIPYFDLLLPVGISFYTFQTLSYTIDVYRGERKAERHFGVFAVFVSFFPQLVAGPIERSTPLINAIRQKVTLKASNIVLGVKLMIWGYFLKIVVADRAAIYVDAAYNNIDKHNGSTLAIATVFFAFQIYGDFAGYSSIAIGAARTMGISLMQNFNRPYAAASIREFWTRWHISLSTWFRDYLYIPLGGNKVSRYRWYLNLFIVFLVSGIWHGAAWTFVFWGALHGLFIVAENRFDIARRSGLFNILMTFTLVCTAWVFFRADSVPDALTAIMKIYSDWGMPFIPGNEDVAAPVYACLFILILAGLEWYSERKQHPHNLPVHVDAHATVQALAYAALAACILCFGTFGSSQFIYFQF